MFEVKFPDGATRVIDQEDADEHLNLPPSYVREDIEHYGEAVTDWLERGKAIAEVRVRLVQC